MEKQLSLEEKAAKDAQWKRYKKASIRAFLLFLGFVALAYITDSVLNLPRIIPFLFICLATIEGVFMMVMKPTWKRYRDPGGQSGAE